MGIKGQESLECGDKGTGGFGVGIKGQEGWGLWVGHWEVSSLHIFSLPLFKN